MPPARTIAGATTLAPVEFSGFEVLTLAAGAAATLLGWGRLLSRAIWVRAELAPRWCLVAPLLALASVGAIVPAVVLTLAAADVRSSGQYTAFYIVLGFGWTGANLFALRWGFGLQVTDLTERRNPAAAVLLVTGTIASAFAYAGGNIGDGPGVHVVLFCAGLAQLALYALTAAHAAFVHTSYRILVDRDLGTAHRFGCLIIAAGLLLGRAVAGTWSGYDAALADFARIAWLAAVLLALDIALARRGHDPDPGRVSGADALIGAFHLAIAIGALIGLGVPR